MRRTILFHCLAVLVALATPARAQWSVAHDTLYTHYNSARRMEIVHDGTGGVQAALQVLHSTVWGWIAYRVGVDGQSIPGWDPSFTTGAAAFDGAGGAYKVNSTGGQTRLYRVLASGGFDPAWPGGDVLVVDLGPGQYVMSDAARDDSGGVYVATNENHARITLRRLMSDGAPVPDWPADPYVVREVAGDYLDFDPPMVIPDGARGAIIGWSGYENGAYRMRAQRVLPHGVRKWLFNGAPVTGAKPTTGPLLDLLLSGDHVYYFWADDVSPSVREIRLQRLQLANGVAAAGWPAGGLLVTTGHPDSIVARITGDGADGVLVAWTQGAELRGVYLTSAGTPAFGWPAEGRSLLDPGGVLAGSFAVAARAGDGFVAAWSDRRLPGDHRVCVRWILSDGGVVSVPPDTGLVIGRGTIGANVYAALGDFTDGVYVGWMDRRWPDTSEYNNFILSHAPYPNPLDAPPPGPTVGGAVRAWPNPARDAVSVRFAISGAGPARVELLDVAGRVLRAHEVTGAGMQVTRFNRLDALPSGVYFVRVRERGHTGLTRVALVR